MIKNLFVLIGVSGSGKSTLAKKIVEELGASAKIISRDEIRFSMVAEDEEYFSKGNEVFKEFIRQIKESLNTNQNTIVDATHLNRGSRTKLLRAIGADLEGAAVYAVVVLNDLETILKQNRERKGRAYVPESVIKNMYATFEAPTLEEGFKQIMFYKNGELKYVMGGDWEPQ